MSTIKESLKAMLLAVKAQFEAPIVAPVVAAVSANQIYTLADGVTEVTITIKDPATLAEPSVGDTVTIAGALAPAGDITLSDGSVITTDESGIITNIVSAAEPGEPAMPGAPAETELAARVATLEAELAKMKNAPVTAPTATYASETEFNAAKAEIEKNKTVIEGLFSIVEQLVKEPIADPVTLTGRAKDKFDKQNAKEEKFEVMGKALAAMRGKTKNHAAQI